MDEMNDKNNMMRDEAPEEMAAAEAQCPHCARTKQRSDEEKKKLANRLSRIEGQIRGLRKMLDKDAYCMDILTQAAAANAALYSFSRELLASHMHTCVVRDIREGRDETIDELMSILTKMMR